MLLGVLLAQAAWVLAVPPFRGMDEIDHAFRAAGVASGQWRLTEPAEGGRGLLVEVPAELVAASQGQCESLPYIESNTCDGDGPGSDGTVLATTSAAGYVPVYYWIVGTAGESFDGARSLYAMRAASALLCAMVLAIGVLCMTTWVRGPWALVGLLVGLSPTLVYTTTVVAPNGLEMAAGLCLWGALLGLGTGVVDVRRERRLLTAAALGVVLLAGLRGLGPLLVLLILLSVVALRGVRPLLAVAGRHPLVVGLTVALAVATRVAVFAWNRGNVVIPPGALNREIDPSWGQALRWPNWILGSIGAFPYRDQPAPLVVHVLVLLVLVTLLVAAVRHGDSSARRAVVLSALLCLAVPSVLVALTLESRGGIWQGRYLLPFMAGVMVLAGLALDHARWRIGRRDRGLHLLAVAMLAVAHVVSVVHVQLAELDRDVSAQDPGWAHPPIAVTAALALAGWSVLGAVALRFRAGRAAEPAEPAATAQSNAT
ncbi:hypothetical protein GCM10027448_43080 [Nocardioides dilutus]